MKRVIIDLDKTDVDMEVSDHGFTLEGSHHKGDQ